MFIGLENLLGEGMVIMDKKCREKFEPMIS